MRTRTLLAGILAACLASRAFAAAPQTTCASLPERGRYCATVVEGSRNPDVVYYLHGLGGNARNWSSMFAGVYGAWERAGIDPPAVVAISFGGLWFVNRASDGHPVLAERIVSKALPWIEEHVVAPAPGGRRLLVGKSMGGHNAAYLAELHPELFERVVLLSPALMLTSPHAPRKELADYVHRTGAKRGKVIKAVLGFRVTFPSEASWQAASPLERPIQALGSAGPEFFVSAGDRDNYGFQEGALAFHTRIAAQGAHSRWELIPGGSHTTFDPDAIADFLAPGR